VACGHCIKASSTKADLCSAVLIACLHRYPCLDRVNSFVSCLPTGQVKQPATMGLAGACYDLSFEQWRGSPWKSPQIPQSPQIDFFPAKIQDDAVTEPIGYVVPSFLQQAAYLCNNGDFSKNVYTRPLMNFAQAILEMSH
jgi:hypothetical protein